MFFREFSQYADFDTLFSFLSEIQKNWWNLWDLWHWLHLLTLFSISYKKNINKSCCYKKYLIKQLFPFLYCVMIVFMKGKKVLFPYLEKLRYSSQIHNIHIYSFWSSDWDLHLSEFWAFNHNAQVQAAATG